MEPTETKQVLIYRRDLKMRKGKIAAQCCHASMGVFTKNTPIYEKKMTIHLSDEAEEWFLSSYAKIVLSVESEEDLLKAHLLAVEANLPTVMVTDRGRTEFHGEPTRTCIAIGPARSEDIDKITGPEGAVECKLA